MVLGVGKGVPFREVSSVQKCRAHCVYKYYVCVCCSIKCVFDTCRYHLTKVALERKESVMNELEEERETLIAKVTSRVM